MAHQDQDQYGIGIKCLAVLVYTTCAFDYMMPGVNRIKDMMARSLNQLAYM